MVGSRRTAFVEPIIAGFPQANVALLSVTVSLYAIIRYSTHRESDLPVTFGDLPVTFGDLPVTFGDLPVTLHPL